MHICVLFIDFCKFSGSVHSEARYDGARFSISYKNIIIQSVFRCHRLPFFFFA